MSAFKFQKSIQLLNFFAIQEGGKINKLKALKLMWAAERLNLRTSGNVIVNDDFIAMKLGPVPSFTKDMAEGSETLSDEEANYRSQFIETVTKIDFISKNNFDDSFFSKTALCSMESAYQEFGKFDGFKLAEITHLYPEWSKFSHLIPEIYSRIGMNYVDFFNDPADQKFKIFNQEQDQLSFMKDIYNENIKLNNIVYSF